MASEHGVGSISQKFLEFFKDRSILIPLIVGFYVIILGLALTGALNRQKAQIDQARKARNPAFAMLDEDSDKDS